MFDSPWLFLIFLPEFFCFLIRLWQAAFMPVVDFVCPYANIPLDLSATPRRYLSWPCLSPFCLPAFVWNCLATKHLWRYSIGTVATCLLGLLNILWRMYREVAFKVNNANGFWKERLRMIDNWTRDLKRCSIWKCPLWLRTDVSHFTILKSRKSVIPEESFILTFPFISRQGSL